MICYPTPTQTRNHSVYGGTLLRYQVYGRARDLCNGVPYLTIQFYNGWDDAVKAIYKRDALTAVSEVPLNFIAVVNVKRGATEVFKTFYSHFDKQLSKFNAASATNTLPNALTAFALLANSAWDSFQRVSILAGAPSSEAPAETNDTTDHFVNEDVYLTIGSVFYNSNSQIIPVLYHKVLRYLP